MSHQVKKPTGLPSKPTPRNEHISHKVWIAYFTVGIRLEPKYMTFASGLSQLCTLISARGRFKPKSPEHEYLQKNLEEVREALVLEPSEGHGTYASYLPDIVATIRVAQEKFRQLEIDALELQEMVTEIVQAAEGHEY
ncbi:MAG: hypothetical protein Q9209_001951 [Squamulea sp. 1 TL-2023]